MDVQYSAYLDVLGVSQDATEVEIRAAYRERAKQIHPDAQINVSKDVKAAASVEMIQLNAAYRFILDRKRSEPEGSVNNNDRDFGADLQQKNVVPDVNQELSFEENDSQSSSQFRLFLYVFIGIMSVVTIFVFIILLNRSNIDNPSSSRDRIASNNIGESTKKLYRDQQSRTDFTNQNNDQNSQEKLVEETSPANQTEVSGIFGTIDSLSVSLQSPGIVALLSQSCVSFLLPDEGIPFLWTLRLVDCESTDAEQVNRVIDLSTNSDEKCLENEFSVYLVDRNKLPKIQNTITLCL